MMPYPRDVDAARSETTHDGAPAGKSAPRLIELDSVAKVYGSKDGGAIRAVESVNADIREGEFVSILGPSGCGKSTLLMMMAGLLKPSGGEIRFRNQVVNSPLRDFGVVFQDAVLLPWRNVLANVELPGEVAGTVKAERLEHAMAMLELVGLAGFETNSRTNSRAACSSGSPSRAH